MLHQKEALICWLRKFVLSCTIINGELHQKRVKISNKSTKIWCSTGLIFVASKSVLFGATQGKIFQSNLCMVRDSIDVGSYLRNGGGFQAPKKSFLAVVCMCYQQNLCYTKSQKCSILHLNHIHIRYLKTFHVGQVNGLYQGYIK